MDEEDRLNQEELEELQFNIFNSDINLLSVHILLEAFSSDKDVLVLGDFIKGDYWKIDEISEEARDTGDFSSTQDLVLSQVLHTIDYLELGEVKKINVEGLNKLLEIVVKDALQADIKKEELDDLAGYFCAVLDNIFELKNISKLNLEKPGNKFTDYYDRLELTVDNYHRHLEYIVHIGASNIEIEIKFSKEKMKSLEVAMRNYLFTFASDKLIDKKPNYREKRFYFSKQLENLVTYINKFPIINGEANIPFEALSENGFEFVKMISVLEYLGKLKVRNWGDDDVWNIRFHTSPVTIQSLAPSDDEEENADADVKLKSDLSFSEEKGVLKIGQKEAFFRKGTLQYHLVRIIFLHPDELDKEWFFSEVGEEYDQAEIFSDKKFANTAYQVKQRISRDTGIKDFFITTNQSITINPKYLK